jgi:hypothetical protein
LGDGTAEKTIPTLISLRKVIDSNLA